MAPPKTTAKTNGLISNFFKPFIRQQPQDNASQDVGDEIVVASRRQPPETNALPGSSQTQTTPTKRGPGRPRKYPITSASQSFESDGPNSSRPRGRPRKYSPASSPSQSSQSDVTKSPRPGGRPRKTETQQQCDDQLASPQKISGSRPEHFNVNPLTGEADVPPTKDSPFRPAGDNPSQRRVATAVAALSPEPPSPTTNMAAPPPPPQFGAPAGKTPTTSFSSISTLNSAPKSSQASTLPISSSTSSRRVVTDGLQGVTGSDSESEELDDFQTLYFNKRRKVSQDCGVKILGSAPKPQPAKKSTRTCDQNKKSDFFKAFPRSPARPAPKNSLASLVAEHEKAQISDATIASLESAVEEAKKRGERQQALEDAGFDGDALIDAAGSDIEARERMVMALARTEALHDKNHFHFFLDPEPSHANSDFPLDCLPNEPWSKIYRNEVSRKHACISGFAAELAAKFPLPMSVTSWMACQLQYEPSDELCEAYVEILRASGDHDQSISDTWGSLNSVYKTRSLFENNWKDHVKAALPAGLAYMTRLISFRAPAIDSIVSESPPHSTCAAFLDLALMNVDELVKENTSLSMSIADCIEDMLDALTEDSYRKLIPLAVGTMFSPSDLPKFARCRAITSLPASTTRAHKLRRRLALEYFSTAEKKASDTQDWAKSIVRSLKTKPEFRVSESTDYGLLMSLTTVLDIAIDAGWTDYALLIPRQSTGPWGEGSPPTEAENRHNSQIDAITNALKAMASRIRDAGTSHLRRTETKSLIEQVIARLQYGVRSRVKPTKGVFDEGKIGAGKLRQATLNASGFGKKVEERDIVEVVPVEELSDREGEADDEEEKDGTGGAETSRSASDHLPTGDDEC